MTALREKLARALCDDTLKRWRTPLALQREPWREFLEAADSILATIEESGLVIVPREATEEMRKAGGEIELWNGGYDCSPLGHCATQAWEAMLAAAPKEPTA